jgi:hypothetical protein
VGRSLRTAGYGHFAVLTAAALLLAACSRAPIPHPSFTAARPPPSTPATAHQTDTDADLVAAVGSDNSAGPISVKFRIDKRPQLGTPVQILITIIPAADAQIGHLHGAFQPDTGLNLQGEHSIDAKDLRAGEPLEQQLTVVPEQPGVLNINATFTLDLDGGSVSRSYSIPVIVADHSS